MKTTLFALGLIGGALAVGAPPVMADPMPTVTFTLLTPLPTQMSVGETAVIRVRAISSEPFVMSIALSDAYFPGRAVRFDGGPAQPGATSADHELTITARAPTADLPAAQDWPTDEDWPAGIAPLAVRVGVRFGGGLIVGTSYVFGLTVT